MALMQLAISLPSSRVAHQVGAELISDSLMVSMGISKVFIMQALFTQDGVIVRNSICPIFKMGRTVSQFPFWHISGTKYGSHSKANKSEKHQSCLECNPLICTLKIEWHQCFFLSRPLRMCLLVTIVIHSFLDTCVPASTGKNGKSKHAYFSPTLHILLLTS